MVKSIIIVLCYCAVSSHALAVAAADETKNTSIQKSRAVDSCQSADVDNITLSDGQRTINTATVGVPVIVAANPELDLRYQVVWHSEHGVFQGQGTRVNFIPNAPGQAVQVSANVFDDSVLCSTKVASLEVKPPMFTSIQINAVKQNTDGSVVVEGLVKDLPQGDWKLVAFEYDDVGIFDRLKQANIQGAGPQVRFSLSLHDFSTSKDIHLMLVDQQINPNTPKYCFTGRCFSKYTTDFTKKRLPFSIDHEQVLASAVVPIPPRVQHHNPQIQYILNAFSSTPVTRSVQNDARIPSTGWQVESLAQSRRYFLYDQALAIMALTHAGELDSAKKILNALWKMQMADGGWFYYSQADGDHSSDPDKRSSGPIAWTLIAINFYTQKTGDRSYLPMANNTVEYLKNLLVDTPFAGDGAKAVLFDGVDSAQTPAYDESKLIAIEHNLDSYRGFLQYAQLTGDETLAEEAERIKQSILGLWNEDKGYFYPGYDFRIDGTGKAIGYNKGDVFLDTQSWTILALGSDNLSEAQISRGLAHNCHTFFEPAGYVKGGKTGIAGFFDHKLANRAPNFRFVWTEGTLGMIQAMMYAEQRGFEAVCHRHGTVYNWQTLLNGMNAFADENGGLYYATFTENQDFGYDFSIAGTAWLYFVNVGFNPFTFGEVVGFN